MLLRVDALRGGYGHGEVLHGVSLEVPESSVVAVLGPNGAGKSTLLKMVAGLLRPASGSVSLNGVGITGRDPEDIARCGVYLVPEGRAVFPSLTVEENLRMSSARPERDQADLVERALEQFPVLVDRRQQAVGTMSGGERQMVALARAMIADPKVLLLDEPSLGLAPVIVDEVFEVIERIRAQGTSLVIVDQYVHRVLALADVVHVMDRGSITFVGDAGEVQSLDLARQYLGVAG